MSSVMSVLAFLHTNCGKVSVSAVFVLHCLSLQKDSFDQNPLLAKKKNPVLHQTQLAVIKIKPL